MKKLIATAALLVVVPVLASAQNTGQRYRGQGYFFFAAAPSHAFDPNAIVTAPTDTALQFGGGGEWLIGHGVGLGGEYFNSRQSLQGGPLDTRIGSIDVSYHFGPSTDSRNVEPFVTGGYTFFCVPGTDFCHENGGNFGGGVNIWLSRHAALRLEIRDDIGGRNSSGLFQSLPLGPVYLRSSQHLVGFRVGVTLR
jgi:Outer membrane protein beta-barrel domain